MSFFRAHIDNIYQVSFRFIKRFEKQTSHGSRLRRRRVVDSIHGDCGSRKQETDPDAMLFPRSWSPNHSVIDSIVFVYKSNLPRYVVPYCGGGTSLSVGKRGLRFEFPIPRLSFPSLDFWRIAVQVKIPPLVRMEVSTGKGAAGVPGADAGGTYMRGRCTVSYRLPSYAVMYGRLLLLQQ